MEKKDKNQKHKSFQQRKAVIFSTCHYIILPVTKAIAYSFLNKHNTDLYFLSSI